MQYWPRPQNIKELRGFLGLTGYYRKFIQHHGSISRPLTNLLKKGTIFHWSPTVDAAFELLKQTLVTAPVLALPDFSKAFVLETDACNTGIGAVLMQEGHPVAFLSQALNTRNQARSTYEKECLAIILAVDKWRSYLQHRPFVIRTDQKSLMHLSDQRLATGLRHKAFARSIGLQYTIHYKQGINNAAADALSRRQQPDSLLAISSCTPSWTDNLANGYSYDPVSKALLTELSVTSPNEAGYSLQDGVIKYRGQIWVGNNELAQSHILKALHSSGIGGHSGIQGTYHRVKSMFAWPHLKKSVHEYVQSCHVCQEAKTEHVKLPGLLQPLPVPKKAWDMVNLDFVEGLQKSNSYTTILVVIDRFSKYPHFIPLAHPFTASQVAQAYMDNVYKLHGLPTILISNRDRIFTSVLWQELFRKYDT